MTTQLEQLLRRAVVALNDWTQTYAEEFCDPENVEQAKKRIEESGGTIAYIADLVSDINAFLAQPEQADRFEDFPVNDWNEPIIYDTNEIDQITHALTGDEGEQDSVTVLHSLVGYLNIVHPGKTMTQVLIETEEACGTVQPVPTSDTSQDRVDESAKQRHEPVAWMDGYRNIYSLEEKAAGCEDAVIPLYPHPQAREPQPCPYVISTREGTHHCSLSQREPLTDEQIEDEWERLTGHSIFGGDRAEGRAMYLSPDEVTEFARAIEAAHGIGEKK